MHLTLSRSIKQSLSEVKRLGISQIKIYKFHDYITVVTFVLMNGEIVSIRSKEVCVAPRFEVFTISTSDELINGDPESTVRLAEDQAVQSIFIVTKYNWSVATSVKDQASLLGSPEGATTQSEGLASEIPENALNTAKYEAGIKIRFSDSSSFFVVTSINPFDLAVSHEATFSEVDESMYELQLLC